MAQIEIENVICSHCGKESKQYILLSDNYPSEIGLDSRPSKEERANFEYDVQMCPHCHYCSDDISIGGEIELGAEYIRINEANIDALSKRLILAYKVKFAKKEYDAAFQLLLQATWILEDNKNPLYNKMLSLLINQLEASIKRERNLDYELVLIDLLRRTGNLQRAESYINTIGILDDEDVNALVAYQLKLIKKGDTAHHLMEEIYD